MQYQVWKSLAAVRESRPLTHCITNFVSMDIMANVLLAVGASPAMAHSIEEVEDFVKIASALVINIGTITQDWVASMKAAAAAANALNKVWCLDPVGCGATPFRTRVIRELYDMKPTFVRGNASEIIALAGVATVTTKGVDSTAEALAALPAAMALAKNGSIIAVSGSVDYVTDGETVIEVLGGSEMLPYITATGCSVTAMCAAFCAVTPREKVQEAVAHGLACFGLAAELAVERGAKGPASLRTGLLDALYTLREAEVTNQDAAAPMVRITKWAT